MENSKGAVSNRSKYIKYGAIIVAVVLILAILLTVFLTYNNSFVATVGNEKITTTEFNFFFKQTKSQMFENAKATDNTLTESSFWNTKINGENAIDIAKKNALQSAVELKIQVMKAKEKNMKPPADQIKNLESSIKSYVDQQGNSIKADKEAKNNFGVNIGQLRQIYTEIILASEYVAKEVKFTDQQKKEFYEKNKDLFLSNGDMRPKGEEAVWARHILIGVPKDAKQEDKDKAKKKADEVLAKAKNGEDFIKLASEYSEDGNAKTGGDYVFAKGKMVPEFDAVAFALKPGDISDLVKTEYGYHIIKLEEKYAKDQPASLKCATEYSGYQQLVSSKLFSNLVEEWKKDPKYKVTNKDNVLNTFK